MLRAGALAPAAGAALPHGAANRRLAWGLFVSLLFHALILSLQFGVPGMALQGARSAINIMLAHVLPPVPQPQPEPVAPDPVPPAPRLSQPAPVTGMRLVDPVAKPLPAPPPRPKVDRKNEPRKPPRVSAPLPKPEADAPVRVIAQASNPDSEFVVPLPQPEEAVQKTIDPAEAQHGSEAVAEVEEKEPSLPQLEQPLLAEREAEEQLQKAADEERLAAVAAREQEVLAQQRMAVENAERQKLEEQLAQQRRAQELAERQKSAALLAQQRMALAEQQKSEELLAQQRSAQELIERERQKSEEILAQQRRDRELAERKIADEQLARQRLAREVAERQRLNELAAARKLADERARQDAEREREAALARAVPPGDPFGAADGQGGGGKTKGSAGNYGSDLSNRVRDLSKGLDLLTGSPPALPRQDDGRQQRRVVADSADRDVPLRMYVESWRQKIERNGSMNFPKLIGDRARIDPLVSVAVRSDGSIEDVTIVRSSGRQDTDDAVRRIVRINALYSKFPPNIAARYDVIEIRRVWTFDQVLKLIEEVR